MRVKKFGPDGKLWETEVKHGGVVIAELPILLVRDSV
jgi:hypothetical protein